MNKIQIIRRQLNITQKELATKSGIPIRTIQEWEQGRSEPPEYVLRLMLYALQYMDENKMQNLSKINLIKMDQILDAVEVVKKYDFIKKVIVFGSAVRSDCTEESDIDLCLTIDGDINSMEYFNAAKELRKACRHNCDILVENRMNDIMRKEIREKGVEVYVS